MPAEPNTNTIEIPTESDVIISIEDLSGLHLFHGESRDVLEGVVDICEIVMADAGEALLSPEQANTHLYFILEGKVHVQLQQDDFTPLTVLQDGECFGEMSIISKTSTSAWVIADTDCRLVTIAAQEVWALINRSHIVPRNLLRVMCSRIRHDNNMMSESLRKQQQYEYESRVDVLTGLRNRRWLDEMLPRYVDRYRYNQKAVTILMMDVDHFKQYNDNYGHLAGDQVLASVAHSIMSNIRPNDAAARYGGEEFVVILPETEKAEAYIVAERLRKAIANISICEVVGAEPLPGITASLGIASLEEKQGYHDLLNSADMALYQAKESGRNCICV
ncbi:MAG: diguanylate cyclase [Gammaproteobacteria bacterium]|nr:MAG: diguanylate cyclase [Gammaproteobacteria bacterium]